MRISDWSSDVCSSDLPRLRAGRHFPEHLLEIVGREGEAVAHGFQRAVLALRLAVTGHPQEDAGDQRLGFLVPMRLAGFAGSVIDQDRQRVVLGKRGLLMVEQGGGLILTKKKEIRTKN